MHLIFLDKELFCFSPKLDNKYSPDLTNVMKFCKNLFFFFFYATNMESFMTKVQNIIQFFTFFYINQFKTFHFLSTFLSLSLYAYIYYLCSVSGNLLTNVLFISNIIIFFCHPQMSPKNFIRRRRKKLNFDKETSALHLNLKYV